MERPPRRDTQRSSRTAALADVTLVLAVTLAAMAAFARSPAGAWEQATVGWPFIEYALMMAVPLLAAAVRRRPAHIGVSLAGAGRSLHGALLCMVPYAAAHALLATLPPGAGLRGVAGAALGLSVLVLCAWLLRARPTRGGLLGIAPLPLLLLDGGTVTGAASAFLFFALFLGPGEEILFRGYIQSRLNRAFGRPANLGGERWGWALPLTAALFGAFHVLNLPDLYAGVWAPAWWAGLATFTWGLFFGWLREWGGSVLAPAAVHGIPQGLAAAVLGG